MYLKISWPFHQGLFSTSIRCMCAFQSLDVLISVTVKHQIQGFHYKPPFKITVYSGYPSNCVHSSQNVFLAFVFKGLLLVLSVWVFFFFFCMSFTTCVYLNSVQTAHLQLFPDLKATVFMPCKDIIHVHETKTKGGGLNSMDRESFNYLLHVEKKPLKGILQ